MVDNVWSGPLEFPVALVRSMEEVFNALLSLLRQDLRVRHTW